MCYWNDVLTVPESDSFELAVAVIAEVVWVLTVENVKGTS